MPRCAGPTTRTARWASTCSFCRAESRSLGSGHRQTASVPSFMRSISDLNSAPSTVCACSPTTGRAIRRAAKWRPSGGRTRWRRARPLMSPCQPSDRRRCASRGRAPRRVGSTRLRRGLQAGVIKCPDERSPPSAGAAWMDFEALARGGRYTFEVRPYFGDSWRVAASRAYLTLGERGAGPRAPSDLSLVVTDDGLIRLSWKDNSSDELGFEIQTSSTEGTSWRRLLAVPAGTESVAHDYPHSLAGTRFRGLCLQRATGTLPAVNSRSRLRSPVPAGRMRRRSACRTRASR